MHRAALGRRDLSAACWAASSCAARHPSTRPAGRQVAMDQVVRQVWSVTRSGFGRRPSRADQLGQDFGGVAEQADRHRLPAAVWRASAPARRRGRWPACRGSGAQAEVDAALLALDVERTGAGKGGRQRLRAAHAAEARGQDPAAGQARRQSAGARPRRRSRRCPARCPGCRCRSTSRPSSGRTSSGPCGRVRGSAPRSPTSAPGSSWRSARVVHPRGCGTRPPACPTAPAASRLPSGRSAIARMASKHSQLRAALPMPP